MTTVSDVPVSEKSQPAGEPAVDSRVPALSVTGLTKRFADVVASSNLTMSFYRGEVHAILGENGAGKSTLVKMLYGFYKPDAGTIEMDGEVVHLHSPADARRRGIGMVFQNFTLIPAFTVLENVALANQTSGLRLDTGGLGRRIRELSVRYDLDADPSALVRDLSVGEQQRVEILKLLAGDPRILILDEPTSVLAPHEVASLLNVVRRLRDDGYAVILISHKLAEVFACADRVSVLRRGGLISSGEIRDFDHDSLLTAMLGEHQSDGAESPPQPLGTARGPGVSLRNVSLRTDDGRIALRNIDLEVAGGEIVGIAAVSGNGQASLGEAVLGSGHVFEGSIRIGDVDMTHRPPAERLAAGLALVPEDPVRDGSVPEMAVSENLALTRGSSDRRPGLFLPSEMLRLARAAAARSPFTLPQLSRQLGTLSGGNIQRVVLARELSDRCRVVLAYHPTRGLDIGSTQSVHSRLSALRGQGAAILLISEDLEELRALSDRIVVLYHGAIAGSFSREEADLMRIGRLMTMGAAG